MSDARHEGEPVLVFEFIYDYIGEADRSALAVGSGIVKNDISPRWNRFCIGLSVEGDFDVVGIANAWVVVFSAPESGTDNSPCPQSR